MIELIVNYKTTYRLHGGIDLEGGMASVDRSGVWLTLHLGPSKSLQQGYIGGKHQGKAKSGRG